MKGMHLTVAVCGLLLALTAGHPAWADVLNMGGTRNPATGQWTGLASLETVPVGNAGNAGDTRYPDTYNGISGFGQVNYTYRIGKYEVTAGQYTEFLNAVAGVDPHGLYSTNMGSISTACQIERFAGDGTAADPYQYRVAADRANRPVNNVNYWNALRFANWLHNGQPSGTQDNSTTEDGAYTLTPEGIRDYAVNRNAAWKWAVTSEDEWYKAAYYDPARASYYVYPTSSNTAPGRDLNDVSGNNANGYGNPFPIQPSYYTTVVGEFQYSTSPYGTFDQGGNVWELNEATVVYPSRGIRGGSFEGASSAAWSSYSSRYHYEGSEIGFRVVQAPIPGDVDGDWHVDVVDLLFLVDAFGSMTGDANYDTRCDFNNDGTVDVVDLLDLVYNFGT
jgi:formylglycine-generating enzyme required for sulfatase activity